MSFGPTTYGLGLLAGALSTLSPCVLPLLPVLLAAAAGAHRWGALALGAGLALSFTLVGIFLATLGASLGLDPDTFRHDRRRDNRNVWPHPAPMNRVVMPLARTRRSYPVV